MIRFRVLTLIFLFYACDVHAQDNYSSYSQQSARLNLLVKNYPQHVSLRSLTKTTGAKDIWQLSIGTGKKDDKPAIVIVGGVEGNHLLGTELAIGFAETLLNGSKSDSIKSLLEKTTFYIFPNMSPDATEHYFSSLKYERQGNATTTDDDRDGKYGEDPFDDLDGNGKITMMRVASPIGEYKEHPDDARVLLRADASKGEKGKYHLFTEGTDNDKDGIFNEDGEGGVWFNRNFSYKHPSFTPGSGEFAVSEKETRALLDYLFEQYNVYAVVSFGSNNNLSAPYSYNATTALQPLIGSWLQADVKTDSLVSEIYNSVTGLKDAPKSTTSGGDFLSWAYYHYGRYSFSTPGWWIPKSKPDTSKGQKAFTKEDPLAHYLRWADQEAVSNAFTPWKIITHPDFPGQEVQVGGADPFAVNNPPYKLVNNLVTKHSNFLIRLASLQPEIDIINVKKEKVGEGLTRITADVINKGALATQAKIGERNYWVKRITAKIILPSKNQAVLSGRPVQTLNALEGYSSQQVTWLIKGSGKISLEVGSPATGFKTIEISL